MTTLFTVTVIIQIVLAILEIKSSKVRPSSYAAIFIVAWIYISWVMAHVIVIPSLLSIAYVVQLMIQLVVYAVAVIRFIRMWQ